MQTWIMTGDWILRNAGLFKTVLSIIEKVRYFRTFAPPPATSAHVSFKFETCVLMAWLRFVYCSHSAAEM